ncbi:MAG: T9SS type A sorting domain-containing protein [Bacteroidota bacterium]|nr:T9SS type A sorting domain-containing protein [Bacteroidota bacterium]
MKLKTVLLLFVGFSFISEAREFLYQSHVNDSVYVEILSDTVKIWDKNVYENCCVSFIHEISIVNDYITIIEKDTSTNYCRCMCYYDLCATILSLNAGSYHVSVYRTFAMENYDSLYFIDSTSFVYGGISFIKPKINTYQSECNNPTAVKEIENRIPEEFSLEQNYPNPFNPVTVIRYSLPVNSLVTLKVYNMLGQEVATFVDGMQDAGYKLVEWNAESKPSGLYVYKLNAGKYLSMKKMLLIQ